MGTYLKIADAVNGKQGEIYFTIDGQRIHVPGVQKIEAHDTIKERTLNTIGTVKTQTGVAGVEGSGTMTVQYYAIKILGEMVDHYRRTGKYKPFEILIINEDPNTSIGRRSIAYLDVVLTGDVPSSVLDASSEDGLTIDISFKYGDKVVNDNFGAPTAIGRD